MNVNDISETSNVSTDTRLSPEHREPRSGHGYGTNDPNSQEASEDSSRTSRRFIGDLNPESVFRSATSPATATRGFPSQEGIGTWLVENLKSSENPRESDSHSKPEGIFFTPNASSTTQKLLSSFLEEECFLELPSEIYLSQLLLFYAEKIYPMFPIIDIKFFQSDIEHNSKILLSQAMCLLASTNPQCKGMLYLRGKNDLLPPRLFGYRLFCAMRCIIDIGLISNKIVQIQALGALALFTEGPEGPEAAAQLHGKMIQLVYTLGLHVQSQHDKEEYEVTSLCCAWAIDRLNAAIHGRPVLMHERDMDRDLNKCIHSQSPAFRLLLLVISQLDQVIDLYRPNSKSAETEFNCPAFEDLIVSAQCVNLPAGFLSKYK
jgi:Fungal specific transcription factor domain